MFGGIPLLPALAALSLAAPAAAQDPPDPRQTPAPPTPAAAPGDFPAGAEVLSVDGESLGVLAYVDSLDGERLLHIRRPDGTVTTAPSVVASRGERAVVLEWTRAEFESPRRASAPAAPPRPQ